jgi:Uma2 family endonuclease
LLSARVPPTLHVRNQEPITLETSEPEPDIAIVRGAETSYRDRHAHAGEVALAVEVADTSLETDRLKGRVYGRAGIPQYWIINLVDRCIEIYTLPSATVEHGYASREAILEGDIDVALDGASLASISVADVLP